MTNDEFFGLARHSIWRLETLPQYNPRTDQALEHWHRTGELLPLAERPGKRDWMEAVARAVAAGKYVGRVRIHLAGGDPYASYELAVYPENAAAGEDIRIADLSLHPELAELGGPDYWLFDDELVMVMDYDEAGQFLARHLTRDTVYLDMARRRRDFVVVRSVPLADFLALEPQRG